MLLRKFKRLISEGDYLWIFKNFTKVQEINYPVGICKVIPQYSENFCPQKFASDKHFNLRQMPSNKHEKY